MYHWIALVLVGCGFRIGAGEATNDAQRIDTPVIDAPSDAPVIDAPVIDAPVIDARLDAALDAPPAPPFCDSADPSLRACYRFESSLTDGSMYANGGGGGASYSAVNGHIGAAFVATGNTVLVPDSASLQVERFTVKLWVRPSSFPTSVLVRQGLIDNTQVRMFVHSGGAVRCSINGGLQAATTTTNLVANTWTRVACVYNLSTIKVYFDGLEVGSVSSTAALRALTSGTTIGRNNPSGEDFDGLIDDLQIFGAVVPP